MCVREKVRGQAPQSHVKRPQKAPSCCDLLTFPSFALALSSSHPNIYNKREAGLVSSSSTDRQTVRETDRQTDRQTERQTDRQTDRQTKRHIGLFLCLPTLVFDGSQMISSRRLYVVLFQYRVCVFSLVIVSFLDFLLSLVVVSQFYHSAS